MQYRVDYKLLTGSERKYGQLKFSNLYEVLVFLEDADNSDYLSITIKKGEVQIASGGRHMAK